MKKKSNNTLIKVLVFVIIAALSCLFFFGLGDPDKTDMQLVRFGFLMFAELVVCLSVVLAGTINSKKLEGSDIISVGGLYALAVVIINYIVPFVNMRPLIVFNVAAILFYALLLLVVTLNKK